jgi:hypothetical protein
LHVQRARCALARLGRCCPPRPAAQLADTLASRCKLVANQSSEPAIAATTALDDSNVKNMKLNLTMPKEGHQQCRQNSRRRHPLKGAGALESFALVVLVVSAIHHHQLADGHQLDERQQPAVLLNEISQHETTTPVNFSSLTRGKWRCFVWSAAPASILPAPLRGARECPRNTGD